MRARPARLDRLPEQYFTALLARVAAAAAQDGEALIDLGRGNPDIGPPPHVAEALCAAARRSDTHGYAPFAGLPALKEAIAARYRDVYAVDVDPEREVAVLPGAKTGLMEFAQVCVERGDAIVLPDPGYPDYRSAVALAAAQHMPLPLLADARPDWDAAPSEAAALYLNYPSNPVAAYAPDGVFEEAIAWAERAGAWVMHDFAYGDLVFDGRKPASFLAVEGDGGLAARLRGRQRRDRREDREPAEPPVRGDLHGGARGRRRGTHRPAGECRGPAQAVRGAPRSRARGTLRARRAQRGHVLRLVQAA